MSGVVNSATLFPLSNSLLAVRLLFCGYEGWFTKVLKASRLTHRSWNVFCDPRSLDAEN
jgi:hypothetical protein